MGSSCYAYEYVSPETDSAYVFQKNEYAHISTAEGDYVILVRDIWLAGENDGEDDYLVVTKYSFLRSTYPFCAGNHEAHSKIHGRELILHFGDWNHMGTRADAQVVTISSIVDTHKLPDNVAIGYVVEPQEGQQVPPIKHEVPIPLAVNAGQFFCRFGTCTAGTMGVACFTPVSDDLLGWQQRWPRPRYSEAAEPVVLDASPNVLGTSEGFSQAGFRILAAIGFDKDRHSSWKVSFPRGQSVQ